MKLIKSSVCQSIVCVSSLLLLFNPLEAYAADPVDAGGQQTGKKNTGSSPYESLKTLPKRYVSDAGYILTSPMRIEKEDLLPLLLVFGGTVGLMAADESIQGLVQDDMYDEDVEDVLHGFKFLGDGLWDGAICGGCYIGGLMFRDERLKEVAIAGGESLLIAGGISQAIKNLSGRYRPEADKGAFAWRGPTVESSISFPSGHATMSFALASVVATVYDDNIFIGMASYGTAAVVAFERVYSDSHWTSDVFFGAALGIAIGRTLVLHNREQPEYSLMPVYDPEDGRIGLALSKKW